MLAEAHKSKNIHFIALAMGHWVFAGTHGADAVSGDCSNFAGDIGLEVASIYLGFG